MGTPSIAAGPAATGASAAKQRLELIEARRQELKQRFVHRFWLRWHMALMLAATFGAGFLTNALLLAIPLHSMSLRWLIALVFAYAVFFACVRLWLAYVGVRPIAGGDFGNALDATGSPYPGGSWGAGGVRLGPGDAVGGGGRFGGAGAGGAFDFASAGKAPVDSVLSGAGDALDASDDGGIVLVVVGFVALVVLAVAAGGVAYLVLAAPGMLVDAAFGGLLAGGLVKSVRRMGEPDWEGSVLRSTWKPFTAISIVVLGASAALQWVAPGARTLGEVLMLVR
ncbi:MAG: hypothetical protein ABI724_00865 [Betaproteobacteria bacterium]